MKKWFAFEYDREDNDWGTGTYDWDEAQAWLADQHRKGNDNALIAVIEEGDDPICVEEITHGDI